MTVTVKVGIVGAGDVVREGLEALVAQDSELVLEPTCHPTDPGIDVLLYDAGSMVADGGAELFAILEGCPTPVIVVGRPLRPALAARALHHGAAAQVSLESPSEFILATVRAVSSGDRSQARDYPTAVIGGTALTSSEVQVLEGIALGLPNSAICADLHLSPNTVKSIIRNAYRKLGVTSRSQAVAWCLEQGFDGWQRDEMP